MKHILGTLVLAAAPMVLAAAMQSADRSDTPQTTGERTRSQSSRSTSHDRHMRKHRTTNHHRRPRTTAKGHTR